MFPPNFEKPATLWKGIAESLRSPCWPGAGIACALPVGLLGARNLMPAWVSWPARALVALCRALHPVIVAILFVKAVGFGALAGILALTVASIGFIGKLFTEAIEEISLKQVEAVRATGASFGNVLIFGVLPQVFARFIGFATYQFDSNLRNSTMVGIVGAGGVGGTLFSAFQRFDYDFVSAILLTPDRHHHAGRDPGRLRARGVPGQPGLRPHPARALRRRARPGLGPGVEYGIEHARRNRRDAQGGGGRMNAHATLHNAGAPREWHRYSLGQRLLRFALYLLLALAIGQAMRGVEIILSSCTTRPSRWPTCSGACGRWTGLLRAACTPRWSRPCTSPRWAPSCR